MREAKEENRIEINFDLSMDALDEYFPGGRENRSAAYSQIERFLLKHNFEHTLLSGYTSLETYNVGEMVAFVNKLFDYFDWAELCMQHCHLTIVKDEIIDALEVRRKSKEMLSRDKAKGLYFQFEETISLDAKLELLKKQRDGYLKKADFCEKEIKRIEEALGR